jgi:hypothetical protein
MKPKTDVNLLEDYGLVDICNAHDFLMIDTSAATDVNWISLSQSQRKFQSMHRTGYSAPVAQRIDYNSLIAALFAGKNLHTTKKVIGEIETYKVDERGGLLSSLQQIINAINMKDEHGQNKVVSFEGTPEFDMYTEDRYFARLAKKNGLSNVDIDLLLHFFTSLHYKDGKCALITNDRGILETYKSFGYRLPGRHKAYSALFGQKYEPSSASK